MICQFGLFSVYFYIPLVDELFFSTIVGSYFFFLYVLVQVLFATWFKMQKSDHFK